VIILNRTTLLVAIVAVAAIGIVIGIILPGALQHGSLSGSMTKVKTELNLTATDIGQSATGNHVIRLDGKLSNLDGVGLPGALVELKQQMSASTTISFETVTTRSDGTFSSTCEEPPNALFTYFAVFRGTYYYDSSQSPYVHHT
jgi:hypothetical protein